MGKIFIKFGYPSSIEEQEKLSERAVFYDCSVEESLCYEFKCIVDSLIKRKGKENFFDLVFLVASQRHVICPKASSSTYIENGKQLPMIVLAKEYLLSFDSSCPIAISQEMINEVGQIFQNEFDYEYAGYERS